MADLQGRKVFKVFNQDFVVDERYNVTKELGQGAYGIVWYVDASLCYGHCSLVKIHCMSPVTACTSYLPSPR